MGISPSGVSPRGISNFSFRLTQDNRLKALCDFSKRRRQHLIQEYQTKTSELQREKAD